MWSRAQAQSWDQPGVSGPTDWCSQRLAASPGHPKAHPSVPSDPCHNGGSCTDGINTAFCDCLPGFQGAFCEEDINECASNPCRNGANCTDCVDSYTCTCPAGFNGIHCENNTPDCTERWVPPAWAEAGRGMDGGGHTGTHSMAPQASVLPRPSGHSALIELSPALFIILRCPS